MGERTTQPGARLHRPRRSSRSGSAASQIMMDRGEDADWFRSSFIVTMAILALLGITGAIGWLLIAKKPIVDLDVFKDRNFAMGCAMIGAMGGILYASAVVIPQLAQQVLGYTATWAGLILSPGGVVVIVLIPMVGRLMRSSRPASSSLPVFSSWDVRFSTRAIWRRTSISGHWS